MGRAFIVKALLCCRPDPERNENYRKKKRKNPAEAGFQFMAGVQGFEPQNGGIKTRCLTAWLYPCRTVVTT